MAEVKNIATRDSYGATLQALAAEHPELVVLDADLSVSTCTAMSPPAPPCSRKWPPSAFLTAASPRPT